MDGIELSARFAYIVNKLRYCGPEPAAGQFLNYFANGENLQNVKGSIKKFESLYPYLSAISKKSQKDFADFEVAESYWIGNNLLDSFEKNDLKEIINSLTKRGLPQTWANKLISELPEGFVPHHNFHVIYVGVGKTTGRVQTNIENIQKCTTSWGEVKSVLDDKLIVSAGVLKKKDNKLILEEDVEKKVSYLREMLPLVKKGDYVAIHWDFAPLVLTEKNLENLKKYTYKILDVVNKL